MAVELRGSAVSLHGHRMHYVKAGSGPVVVLLHGLLGNRQSWAHLMSVLVRDFTVLAPDLFGHGESAKSLADYSLGAHAGTLRDLMETLEVSSATVVGHSLGGGVAMQFAYLFPERCERLALVSSAGLGRELSVLLRAPTLPGSRWMLPLVASRSLREGSAALGRRLRKLGLPTSPDIVEAWRGFSTLGDTDSRRAFLATIRTIVGPGGQTVDAHEKIYLFGDLPVLVVWGARDRLIPARHAMAAHHAVPGTGWRFSNAPGTSRTCATRSGSPRSCAASSRARVPAGTTPRGGARCSPVHRRLWNGRRHRRTTSHQASSVTPTRSFRWR